MTEKFKIHVEKFGLVSFFFNFLFFSLKFFLFWNAFKRNIFFKRELLKIIKLNMQKEKNDGKFAVFAR